MLGKKKRKKREDVTAADPAKVAAIVDRASGGAPELAPTEVSNHRFPPGEEVGVYPSHQVTVERGLGREPFQIPLVTAVVSEDGTLEVSGLPKGGYCAAGPVGDRYAYVGFQVK